MMETSKTKLLVYFTTPHMFDEYLDNEDVYTINIEYVDLFTITTIGHEFFPSHHNNEHKEIKK